MLKVKNRYINIKQKTKEVIIMDNTTLYMTNLVRGYDVEGICDFMQLQHLYDSAISEVKTRLHILDNEFKVKFQRNPIHSIESRLKSPQSIMEKLQRKGQPVTLASAKQHLYDIAGIRVICHYIDDIYIIADMLSKHDDVEVLKRKDYISEPKKNGYRSLHLVISVPVYLSTGKENVAVEIQIRTIAMDFWASLEHQLRYKSDNQVSDELSQQLKSCAERIAQTDTEMQEIFYKLNEA